MDRLVHETAVRRRRIMPRARTCGSLTTSVMLLIGPTGTSGGIKNAEPFRTGALYQRLDQLRLELRMIMRARPTHSENSGLRIKSARSIALQKRCPLLLGIDADDDRFVAGRKRLKWAISGCRDPKRRGTSLEFKYRATAFSSMAT